MDWRYSPWLPVNLSLAWPGLGQLYQKRWLIGLVLATLFFVFISRSSWEVFAANGKTLWGFIYLGAAAVVYALSPWLAHRLHPKTPPSPPQSTIKVLHNSQRASQHQPTTPEQDPWYSLFLEQLLPGMGHLYIGQTLGGGGLLLLGVGLAYAANKLALSLLPLAYGIWAIAGYHAYRTASKTRGHQWALLAIVGLMLLRLMVGYTPTWINHSVLQCIVPSTSMQPALQVDDRIFVRRNARYRPTRGDIVVFLPPAEAIQTLDTTPDTLFVKRIVAVPGDQIQITNGQVWLNQQPLTEPYASVPTYSMAASRVPPESYFVLGDNRNESGDSHVWGTLPRNNILGRAYKIYWPISRVQSLLRG